MKQCINPNCQQFNPDDAAAQCPYCRTPYGSSKGLRKGKRTTVVQTDLNSTGSTSKRSSIDVKKVGLFAGLAVGAAALIAVIFFVVTSLFGTNALGAAAGNSISSLADQLTGQSSLSSYMENMNSLNAKSNRHILVGIQTPDLFLALDTDYAGSKKIMTGSFEFKSMQEDFQFNADFHANKKELRIYAPDLVSDTYGFKYSDFEKKYDKSQLRKFLNLPAAKDIELAPFEGFDLEKFLKKQGGSSWTEFKKSLKMEKYDTRQIALGDRTEECTVYRVQWDTNKAERMLKTIARNTLGILPDFIPELANKIAPDVRFYVNSNDEMIGVDFSFLNSIYTFLLEGEENPWEHASLKIVTAGADPVYYTGGVVSDANGVRIELKAPNNDVYAIYYDSASGKYSVVTPTGELTNGIFFSDSSGFHLESNFHNFSYIIAVSNLEQLPEKATDKYVDLLDMSISEIGRLGTELSNSLGITIESLSDTIDSLFGD